MKRPSKNARKKWETPLEDAMPCKMETRRRLKELRETVASGDTHPHKKTKYACNVEALESTRKRLESALPRNHEDHMAEKGFNSITHNNLVRKFIPRPQAMKVQDAKAAVDKEWDKLQKIRALVRSKKDGIREAQREKNKVHFAALMDYNVISRMPSKKQNIQHTKVESCSEET